MPPASGPAAARPPQVAELLKERYGITDMASLICDPW
jgi:hypothetical protein